MTSVGELVSNKGEGEGIVFDGDILRTLAGLANVDIAANNNGPAFVPRFFLPLFLENHVLLAFSNVSNSIRLCDPVT